MDRNVKVTRTNKIKKGESPGAGPEEVAVFKKLFDAGFLGVYCERVLSDRSTPELRAMSDDEFWSYTREFFKELNRRKHV